MRKLTLDEKISIKGDLKRQSVPPQLLAALDMREAQRLYWVCFGKPVAEFANPDSWRRDRHEATPVQRYVPVGLYTFGCCHYGHMVPFRTAEVAADSLEAAWRKARLEIQIGATEHLRYVGTKPNPAYQLEQANWAAQIDLQRVKQSQHA